MTRPKANIQVLSGSIAVLLSALCFYLSTATIRWGQLQGVQPDPAFYVLVRFLLGFVVVAAILLGRRRGPRPVDYRLLAGRAVANSVAVYCFYQAVKTTSVSHANILNMTYPVFVALIAWSFLPEQRDGRTLLALGGAFAGIMLILYPGDLSLDIQHLWGLGSGLSAALAIVFLNLSRKVHDAETVLFYMFGLGSLLIYGAFFERMVIQQTEDLLYLFICGAFGIAGQYLITLGFRFITAVEGSILSSTRILMAACIGPLVGIDPVLAARGWLGALLIFGANVYLALRRTTAIRPR